MMPKKKAGAMAIAIAVLLLSCVITAIWYKHWHNSRFSLKIGGTTIQEDEYLLFMNDTRQEVLTYFREQYGMTIGDQDWGTTIDGEVPCQVLADRTTEKLSELKALYALAEQRGYVDSTSYKSLIKRMDAENARRKDKIKNGEIVYGLSEYSLHTYLEYEMDSFEKRFRQEEKTEADQYEDAVRTKKRIQK